MMSGKMTINESIYMALSVSEASRVAPLLMGNPGAGKTTSVEFYAKANNMKMVLLRGSQSSPEEILGYEVNDGEGSKRGDLTVKVASKICPDWYDELLKNHENGVRTLLFLDEITTASSFVQAALLQVIFGREINNGYKLPDDTFIVAAGNYSSNLSSDFNLIPPLMNRFCIYNVTIDKYDIDAFMMEFRGRQDIISQLKNFEIVNSSSVDDLDPSFVSLVKRTIEEKLSHFTQDLIDKGKFDPNVTDMSDIYQDQSTGTRLLGFLTPRTLNYFKRTAIFTYLKYGLAGIKTSCFREMSDGLVGISLSKGGNNSGGSKKNLVSNEYIKLIENVAVSLDKRRVNSIANASKEIDRIITKLDTNGNKILIDVLPSSDLISLSKIFESYSSDRDLRKVQCPIEPKMILDCNDIVLSSARNVLKGDHEKIRKIIDDVMKGIKADRSSIDIDKINGNIKNYNDSIKCYKKICEFVKIPEFKYPSDVSNKILIETKDLLSKNKFKIDFVKKHLRDCLGLSMSELVETESL